MPRIENGEVGQLYACARSSPVRVSPDCIGFSAATGAPVSDERETENAYGIRRTSLPRRRRMKPKLSPWTPPAATPAVICMTAVPPGGDRDGCRLTTVAPADATCGCTSATHVPAPSPASDTVTASDFEFAPPPATRYPNESDCGSVKSERLVGGSDPHEPGPLDEYRGLLRERRVGERGTCRRHERRLHLLRRPRRMALRQERRNTCDVRRGEARPVENGELVARELGKRRREDLRAGGGDVRLERVAERRQPRRREARRYAGPGRRHFEDVAREAHRDGAARAGGAARIRAPSRSEIVPPESAVMNANVGSPGRFSAMTMPVAPACRARDVFTLYGHPPRRRGRSHRCSEPPGALSHSCRLHRQSTPTSTSRWLHEIQEAEWCRPTRTACAEVRRCDDLERRSEDVRVRDRTDADGIRSRGRRPRRAEAEEVSVVPGRDDRHDTGAHDIAHGFDQDVRTGIRLRSTAREVDDVHAVANGRLERGDDLGTVGGAAAAERRRRGDVEDAVVPDVRTGRDALDVLDRGMTSAVRLAAEAHAGPAATSVLTPAITPATNVPWNESSRSSGALFAPRPAKPRATITFGVVEPLVPFGNPGGYEKPVGSRNGCSWSTPSSTMATFTPVAARSRRCPELRRAEYGWASVQSSTWYE